MTRFLMVLALVFVATAAAPSRAQEAPDTAPSGRSAQAALTRDMPVSPELARRVLEARDAILAMELERAHRLLDVPAQTVDEMVLADWTREHGALLTLLVADEESDYEGYLERNEALYNRIEREPGTAWRHWLMGEVALQRTWARSKRGDSFKAAWSARRALRHLERARELDPSFNEPLKGIGLLHMGIGALPDRYRRVLGWFGINGELGEGLSELEQAMQTTVWNRVESAVLLATIDKFGFHSPVDAVSVYASLWQKHPGSPLIGLSFADALIRDRRPREALEILEDASDPSGRVHYLVWFRGEALFQLGRCEEAVAAFTEYEQIHEGPSLKLAGRLMAGQCLEQLGRRQDARDWYALIVGERGFAEEQAAMRQAAILMERPMTSEELALMRAWGAFNAGADEKAMSIFTRIRDSDGTSGADRAEAAYGLARIHHEAGRMEMAIDGYQETLDLRADPLEKWHGFARMHLTALYLEAGNREAARDMIEQIGNMSESYDFRASVENRVRLLETDR